MRRCWCYLTHGCRKPGTNSVRIGSHVFHYCDHPDHQPVVVVPPCVTAGDSV